MRRRQFLGTVGVGVVVGGAGCTGGDDSTPDDGAGGLSRPELPLPDSALERGAPKDAIPAITDPVFGEDWADLDLSLDSDDRVVGVAVDGTARAYPLSVLNWHEVVNDTFGGPLLVTYCPLCGSGVTADRLVDGEETVFGVSGYLWRNDLVMYDRRTESLWSQVLGTAVQGPKTGTTLSFRPSTITTWGAWRGDHPDTQVLRPPPESDTVAGTQVRDYSRDPYTDYDQNRDVGLDGPQTGGRLHPKTRVVGVSTDGATRAYPLETVREAGGVVNDRVGDLPVVVASVDGSLVAYDRRVDGSTLTFEGEADRLVAGGSRWQPVSGRAVDGPHEGTTLRRANDRSEMFWFAWVDFYPDSEIYGRS